MSKWIALTAAAMVLGLLGGTALYVQLAARADLMAPCREDSATMPAPDPAGVVLRDGAGHDIALQQVLERPVLLYFGYTYCPDVCPFDMQRNAEVLGLLIGRGIDMDLAFVTVDPDRDTPEVVDAFARGHHPMARGYTGNMSQIVAALSRLRAFAKVPDQRGDWYGVDHSTLTYLLIPGAAQAEYWRRDVSPEAMARAVECMMTRAGAA